MSKEFKAGDLALVVGCFRDPSDIGKCVELVEFVPAFTEYFNPNNHPDVTHYGDRDGWFCSGPNISSAAGVPGFAMYQVDHLAPLRGDFAPEQQKAKEAEPCA